MDAWGSAKRIDACAYCASESVCVRVRMLHLPLRKYVVYASRTVEYGWEGAEVELSRWGRVCPVLTLSLIHI